MDSDKFKSSSKPTSQHLRSVVWVILNDMGAHDKTLDEQGCNLYLYIENENCHVKGLLITEQESIKANLCKNFV